MCRASLVAPKLIHKAGFHPTGGARRDGRRRRRPQRRCDLPRSEFVNALGIAGSMAAGIIEYLAEGTWTKRLHPGWAAQSGIRAADLARAGFVGPRTVFEGTHGFFHGFARTTRRRLGEARRRLRQALGRRVDRLQALCLRHDDASVHRLRAPPRAARSTSNEIDEIVCEAAEGMVHRLWEPLAAKQRAAERLRREVQPALLHRRRLRARPRRPRRVHRGARARPAPARARRQGALRDRPRQSLPRRVHRARAREAEGRHRARGAPAALPRRRARAAVARRPRGEIPAELRLRRLAGAARRELSRVGEKRVRSGAVDLAEFQASAEELDQRVERRVRRLGHQRMAGERRPARVFASGIASAATAAAARRRHHVAPAEDEQRRALHLRRALEPARSRCRP